MKEMTSFYSAISRVDEGPGLQPRTLDFDFLL
jgi:hypothetical protein